MTVNTMEKLQEQGWYLTEHGYNVISDSGSILDVQRIIKRAIDFDLREIGSGQGDLNQGNLVLQIQKLRNVAAPKCNEESRAAPRMLRLSLTDGKNNIQAVEVEHISSVSLNTPPGTKLLIRGGNLLLSHGIILLKSFNIATILGGKVPNLLEKWELNKKLALHTRVRSMDEGGPPSWIPFGKKIIKLSEQDKNFKALADKEKATKEDEFEAQRKDAIAEAAKQGSKKVFGGGNKQLLDHTVQRIVDQGFSIEQAEYALRINRNNVDRALKTLQRNDNKHGNNARETREPRDSREPRETRGKRFEKKVQEDGKPSSGKVSLFDFLEDKLPTQTDTVEETNSQQFNNIQNKERSENNFERYDMRSIDHSQAGKGGRAQRGGRGYQPPPRYNDDSKSVKRTNNSSYDTYQYSSHSGGNMQQSKPPRFQRSQDNQNVYQPDVGGYKGSYNKNDHRNSFARSRAENAGNISESGSASGYNRHQQDHHEGQFANGNRNHSQVDDTRNRHSYDVSYGKQNRAQDGVHKSFQPNSIEKNYKSQLNRHQPLPAYDSNHGGSRGTGGFNEQKKDHTFGNSRTANNTSGGTWFWQIGDKCMAKYWEDNRYYNAEVTAVSERTCVVQFKDFNNYEEVLQVDCIPITEDICLDGQGGRGYNQDSRRQDQRPGNRQRYDQSHNHITGMEFRRGGGGGAGGGPGAKGGFNKRRGPQRSAQPIYQPPAQRGGASSSGGGQHNNPTL
ncbi:tudor domain-containing protein 3 isoform X2 [Cephus cinctus]|uniref:Tudor domain-containing protein 3 n=1 Tax=Cephus cinctus TaxID=211228 RepID=A0AAJ7BSS8_CEPCN|nr:tudor domain-containing protein 3 isoform X2 [Cephus cinctus]